jgi:hypothetical protein
MSVRGVLLACAFASSLAVLGCHDAATMQSPPIGPGAAGQSAQPAQVLPPPSAAGTTAAGAGGMAGIPSAGAGGTALDGTGAAGAAMAGAPGSEAAGSAGVAPDPADAGPPEVPDEQWTVLTEESWTLPPGGEMEQHCADKVLDEDVYVAAIRPIHPPGTHHTTLSVSASATSCSTIEVLRSGIIYAAGVGTEALYMPPGVAMKLPAGYTLRLGLHLYNVSEQMLSGVSGIEIIRVDAADVEHEAELMLAGPLSFSIDPGQHTITNDCMIREPQTVFALFPHMHQTGVHLKTTAVVAGQTKILHDDAYDFREQYQIALDPLALAVGDTIRTECTYENDTDRPIGFGESSDTEMCFSILFRYPATGNSLCAGF